MSTEFIPLKKRKPFKICPKEGFSNSKTGPFFLLRMTLNHIAHHFCDKMKNLGTVRICICYTCLHSLLKVLRPFKVFLCPAGIVTMAEYSNLFSIFSDWRKEILLARRNTSSKKVSVDSIYFRPLWHLHFTVKICIFNEDI